MENCKTAFVEIDVAKAHTAIENADFRRGGLQRTVRQVRPISNAAPPFSFLATPPFQVTIELERGPISA